MIAWLIIRNKVCHQEPQSILTNLEKMKAKVKAGTKRTMAESSLTRVTRSHDTAKNPFVSNSPLDYVLERCVELLQLLTKITYLAILLILLSM